jgi:hypothetical protein
MRVGLTGLGVVFLITMAAAVAFGPSPDAPEVPDDATPGEPLAQLGVAPGLEKDRPPAPQAPPSAVPPPDAPPAPALESPTSGLPDAAIPEPATGGDRPTAI